MRSVIPAESNQRDRRVYAGVEMGDRLRQRITYANVTATLALFVALGGGLAWALGANTVGSRQIKPDAVRGVDADESTFILGSGAVLGAVTNPPDADGVTFARPAGSSAGTATTQADAWLGWPAAPAVARDLQVTIEGPGPFGAQLYTVALRAASGEEILSCTVDDDALNRCVNRGRGEIPADTEYLVLSLDNDGGVLVSDVKFGYRLTAK